MTWLIKISNEIPQENNAGEMRETYSIPEHKFQWLQNKIAQLNKIANKLNVAPVTVTVIGEEIKDDPRDDTGLQKIKYFNIEIHGETPKLQGYAFAARILHTTEGNIFKAVPGENIPEQYRKIQPKCDHCGVNRFRKDTFLLKKIDTNQYYQVGSSCLKDFLGHGSPESYARFAEMLFDFNSELESESNEGWGGGGGSSGVNMETFILVCHLLAKTYGYMSRQKAYESNKTSTADSAVGLIYSKDEKDKRELQSMIHNASAEDKQMVNDAIAWAKSLKDNEESTRGNDYLWNLSVACSQSIATSKTFGILGSLIVAYQKNVLGTITPTTAGVAGPKGSIVVVQGNILEESIFNDQNSYDIKTNDNKIVRFYSDSIPNQVGDVITVKGTVTGYSKKYVSIVTILSNIEIVDNNLFNQTQQNVNQTEQAVGEKPNYVEGQKITVDVTVLNTKEINNPYSRDGTPTTLYTMVDRFGTNLKWFSSGGDVGLEPGERANITATVKKVGVYRDQPDIQITRIKINSKEMKDKANDPRLSPIELKSLKKQYKLLEKNKQQLIDSAGGVTSDYDLRFRESTAIHSSLASKFLLDPTTNYGLQVKEFSNDYLINNASELGSIIKAGLNKVIQDKIAYIEQAQQKIEQLREKIKTYTNEQEARWDKYSLEDAERSIQSSKKTIDSLQIQLAEFERIETPVVQDFLTRISEYKQIAEIWNTVKPQISAIDQQMSDISEKLALDKDYSKQYGPRTAWLSKIMITHYAMN